MTKADVINNAVSTYFSELKRISFDALTGHLDKHQDKEIEIMVRKLLVDTYDAGRDSVFETTEKLESYEDISKYNFREWYKEHQPELYKKFGKCILCIDRKTKEIKAIFTPDDLNASVHYCLKHNLVNQLCDETFYGETIWIL